MAAAAVASQRRRAPASTWPAVSRGTSPSPCCSPTTTSSAEGTARKHCFPHPSSFHSTAAGEPRGEPTDSALGPFTQQPGPALKLRNVKPTGVWGGPRCQGLGHHCQSGARAEPPAHCSQCYGLMFAMPTGRTPSLLSSPCSHFQETPLPDSPLSHWKWTGFVPTKCPNAEKTRLLGPWQSRRTPSVVE